MAGNHRLVAKVAEVLVAAAMLWRSGGSRDEKEEEAQRENEHAKNFIGTYVRRTAMHQANDRGDRSRTKPKLA